METRLLQKNVVFNEVGKFPTVQKNTPYLEDLYKATTETKVITTKTSAVSQFGTSGINAKITAATIVTRSLTPLVLFYIFYSPCNKVNTCCGS